jgi:hypothetical protein
MRRKKLSSKLFGRNRVSKDRCLDLAVGVDVIVVAVDDAIGRLGLGAGGAGIGVAKLSVFTNLFRKT